MTGKRSFAIGLALGLLGALGCGPGEADDPLVARIKQVEGSIEVAENAETSLRQVDTGAGLRLLTRGAALKVPAGSRVELEFLKKKGIFWVHGPADLELTEARLVRGGKGGINDEVALVHTGWYLREGVFAGAMEGKDEDRPSIEIQTDEAQFMVSNLGKFAVIRMPGENGAEAWVRDRVGSDSLRIQLLKKGEMMDFPPLGLAMWENKDGPNEYSVDTGSNDFLNDFLNPLTIHIESFPDLGHLLDEVDRKRMR